MSRRYYSNVAAPAYLSGGIDTSATSFQTSNTNGGSVAAPTGYPASYPFFIVVGAGTPNEEVMQVNSQTGATWNVTRGASLGYGSVSNSHNANEVVDHFFVANDADETNAHVNSSSGVHGLTGAVVGTSDSQTLTNKTLTSPTITGGTVNPTTLQQGGVQAVTTTGSQTLTNKTLTSPAITTPAITGSGGALTLPAGPDTLVGRATTDTLTNKTLTSPVLNGALTGDAASGLAAYRTYTPALTATTTNPVLGTGSTAIGSYIQVGKNVSGRVAIYFGSTGQTAGSGIYKVSLPVAAAITGFNVPIGHGFVYDQSAPAFRLIVADLWDANTCQFVFDNSSTAVGAALPWAWAASDQIIFQFDYEAA